MHFSAVYRLRRYLMAFRRVKQGRDGKTSYFLAKWVDISTTVRDTSKDTISG